MRLHTILCASTLLFLSHAQILRAAIIHETALLGNTGFSGGASLYSRQFIGTPFSIMSDVNVTKIGGHIASSTTIFGAIVPLSGPNQIPDVAPLEIESIALAYTTFSAGLPSSDFRTPLAVFLPAGDYALIFGSGLFGASGGGALINGSASGSTPIEGAYAFVSNINIGGPPNGSWNDPFSPVGWRMVVEANAVPVPATIWLLGTALIGLVGFSKKRKVV